MTQRCHAQATIAVKLAAARTRLMLEQPFVGALVVHLPMHARTGWCETIATDARAIYYNPDYIAALTLDETQFVLAHEALHCALGHFARRAHRTRRRWDVAADYAVNQLLVEEGLKPPPDALIEARYRGLCAEEIYPLVPPDTDARTLDCHLDDAMVESGQCSARGAGSTVQRNSAEPAPAPAAGEAADPLAWDDAGNERRTQPGGALPPPLSARETEVLAREWQGRLVVAAQQARRAGARGAAWLRAIVGQTEPRLLWRAVLARYMTSLARDDYSYSRLSRREGAALLPRLASRELDICVALDTSGSIGDAQLAEFAQEIDALKAHVRARVTLLACDAGLDERAPWVFEPWQAIVLPDALGGGGGTSFVPVFEWVAREHRRPDVLLYFTDAEGDFPASPPDYPVVWLVKGRADVPWGERVQMPHG